MSDDKKDLRGETVYTPEFVSKDTNKATNKRNGTNKGAEAVDSSSEDASTTVGTSDAEFRIEKDGKVYELRSDGVWLFERKKVDKNKDMYFERKICDRIRVSSVFEDMDGNNNGFEVEFKTNSNQTKTTNFPTASLMCGGNQSVLADLMGRGFLPCELPTQNGKNPVLEYLYFSCDKQINPVVQKRLVTEQGWIDEACTGFALGDRIYCKKKENTQYVLAGSIQDDSLTRGTLEDWKQKVAKPSFKCSDRFAFAICSALSAPLMSLVGIQSGAFNFYGESGKGKSTLLYVAGSVWGKAGSDGNTKTWRATENALAGVFAEHRDRCVFLDELGQATDKAMETIAYTLNGGRDKERMDKNAKNKRVKTWNTLMFSSAEKSFFSFRKEGHYVRGFMDGEGARIIDIPAIPSDSISGLLQDLPGGSKGLDNAEVVNKAKEFSNEMKITCSKKCYGTAIRSFLEHLIDDIEADGLEAVRENVSDKCRDIENALTQTVSDSHAKRVAQRFALSAYAGELAISYGVLPWKKGDAIKVAVACFKAWLMSDATPENQAREIMDRLIEFPKTNPDQFMRFKDTESQEDKEKHTPTMARRLRGCVVNSSLDNRMIGLILRPSEAKELIKEFGGSNKKQFFTLICRLNKNALIFQGGDRFMHKIPNRGGEFFGFEAGEYVHVLSIVAWKDGESEEARAFEKLIREGK